MTSCYNNPSSYYCDCYQCNKVHKMNKNKELLVKEFTEKGVWFEKHKTICCYGYCCRCDGLDAYLLCNF